MGIENRNESQERPEQVERFREQESRKGEECKKELGSSSDFKDDKADKTEFSKVLEDKKKEDEAVRVEDMSDLEKSSDKSKESTLGEKSTETPVEEYNVPNREVETATIDESNKFEKIEASTPENSEQSSKDLTLENNLEACESDSKNVVDNDCANTNQMSPEALNIGKENTTDVDSNNLENNAKDSKDVDGIDSKTDEASTEKSNPERTPRWYDSLPEGQIESHQGLESIAKEYVGKEPLSENDKQELSDRQYEYLKGRNPEDRDDCRVYTADSIVSVEKNGEVKLKYPDDTDGAKEGSREMSVIKAGSSIDRIGPPNGKYVSPLNENGKAYSERERGLPDRVIEQPIENNTCYHRYDVKQDLTKENIAAAIDNTYGKDTKESKRMHLELDKYYQDCNDNMSPKHKGDIYSKESISKIDGIQTGEAAPMFNTEGGAKQHILPFSVEKMCNMGLIEENNDKKITE